MTEEKSTKLIGVKEKEEEELSQKKTLGKICSKDDYAGAARTKPRPPEGRTSPRNGHRGKNEPCYMSLHLQKTGARDENSKSCRG